MENELIEFSPLLQRAVETLNNAKTSAEILDARNIAHTAFEAAKEATHLARVTGAAQAVITACHEAQAQALKIESQAKIRLANEYTAAQERGEVQKHGSQTPRQKRDVPDENIPPTVTDIGLTRKEVHEARQLRDAEAKEPGVIAKALDAEVTAGKAPRRAAIKRAVVEVMSKAEAKPETIKAAPKPKPVLKRTVVENDPETEAESTEFKKPWSWMKRTTSRKTDIFEDQIIHYADNGMTPTEIALELDLDDKAVWVVLHEERIRREVKTRKVDPAVLALSAKGKLDLALRQQHKEQEINFNYRVVAEVRKRLENSGLANYREQIDKMIKEIRNRKGILTKQEYRKIQMVVSSDHVQTLGTEWVRIHDEAMILLRKLEKIVLNEQDSPTNVPPIPTNYNELMALRRKVQEERRAKRAANSPNQSRPTA